MRPRLPLLFLTALFTPGISALGSAHIPTRLDARVSDTHVILHEVITQRTGQQLIAWMNRFPPDTPLLLELDSPGGDTVAGIAMSEAMVKRGHVRTRLTATSRCESICAMLWLAGSMEAEPGARLAFHGSSIEPVRPEVPITDQEMIRYILRTCKPVPAPAGRLIGQVDRWQAGFAHQRAPSIGQLLERTGAFSLHRASRVVMLRNTDGWQAFRAVAWRMGRDGWTPVEPPDERDGEWWLADDGQPLQTGKPAPAEHGIDCRPSD